MSTAHKISMMTLSFLKSIVFGFPKYWCQHANRGESSYPNQFGHIFLAVQIWPLHETKFSSNREVKSTVSKCLQDQSKDFCGKGIQKLVFWWEKCVLKNGNYNEKQKVFS